MSMLQANAVKGCCSKHISYDGGNQSSRLFQLTMTPKDLRALFEAGQGNISDHFWFGGVLASHYLKRDQNYDALIVGSAGGQEVKAALMYGAGHIDAVEMVGTVIDLAKNTYRDYIGRIFDDPRVTAIEGEGRSFLRSTDKQYDVIQIFSNHISSTAAAGGAMGTVYLQTVEAYEEYFEHLKADGILHINHHIYPRLVATAALAWKRMGYKSDFQDHVVVLERSDLPEDRLPTLLDQDVALDGCGARGSPKRAGHLAAGDPADQDGGRSQESGGELPQPRLLYRRISERAGCANGL